jgi:hypothetical protein
MHTVLDQISPDLNPAPTFTQLFLSRRDAPRQVGIVEQFRDFAARMSRQSTYASPAFAKTAQNLGEGSAALVVKAATVKKPAKDDPLAEIADFATGDKEDSSGDIEVARDAYRRLVADLKKQITTAIVEGQECESAENNATVDQHLRNNDAAFAEAQLGALNTTTGDLNKTAVYFDTQLKALHKDFADFDALVKLEGEQYTKLSKDLQSFTQQMLSVATELAGVGDKKVGKEVEAIVERLQQHLSAVSYRHDMYARWKSTVSDGTTGLPGADDRPRARQAQTEILLHGHGLPRRHEAREEAGRGFRQRANREDCGALPPGEGRRAADEAGGASGPAPRAHGVLDLAPHLGDPERCLTPR